MCVHLILFLNLIMRFDARSDSITSEHISNNSLDAQFTIWRIFLCVNANILDLFSQMEKQKFCKIASVIVIQNHSISLS